MKIKIASFHIGAIFILQQKKKTKKYLFVGN